MPSATVWELEDSRIFADSGTSSGSTRRLETASRTFPLSSDLGRGYMRRQHGFETYLRSWKPVMHSKGMRAN